MDLLSAHPKLTWGSYILTCTDSFLVTFWRVAKPLVSPLDAGVRKKGKVYRTPLKERRRVIISLSQGFKPVGIRHALLMRTTNVCDAWPVWRQTRGYLPIRKASLPIDWYQIILLGDRGTCVLTTYPGLHSTAGRPGFELTTCWSQVQHPNHSATWAAAQTHLSTFIIQRHTVACRARYTVNQF